MTDGTPNTKEYMREYNRRYFQKIKADPIAYAAYRKKLNDRRRSAHLRNAKIVATLIEALGEAHNVIGTQTVYNSETLKRIEQAIVDARKPRRKL